MEGAAQDGMSHQPWCYLEAVWTWHLGTWVSGGLGTAGGTVGLDDLRGLLQALQFCDPVVNKMLQLLGFCHSVP